MNLMQLPDERNSKRQISEEKEQKKNGHKKYNLYYTLLTHSLSYGLFSVEARKPDHRGEDSMGRREVKGEMLNECTE